MNGTTLHRRNVIIANPNGLHMRPATMFAQQAKKFQSAIRVRNGSNLADGKSSLDLILLVALPGAELTLEIEGPDAAEALEQLAAVLADPGDGC